MSKTPTREAKTQALIPVSRGQIVKAGELAEKGGTTVVGEFGGSVPPALLWVKDAPLFIDDQGLARFYDAVVRPAFKDNAPFKLKISESDKNDLETKLGIKGKFGLSSWLSSILGAELEVSGEGKDNKSKTKSMDQEITLEPISTSQRQLDQLLAFYVFNQHDKHHQYPDYPFMFVPMKPEMVGNKGRVGFSEWAGPFGLKLHVNALGETIPDDRIARMLDALTDEMQWRKRPLTDGEFRDLLHTVCNSSSSAH
jgi:hypothetical protein